MKSNYYGTQSPITDPLQYGSLFLDLPYSVKEIIQGIQGIFFHVAWAKEYGLVLKENMKEHANARTVPAILQILQNLKDTPLHETRPLEKRFYGTCRDYALLLTAILRWKGIPARCRCGFATYFTKGKFEDHWLCEYWESSLKRWICVDPQLDRPKRDILQISFDPLDVPEEYFFSGAKAWLLCREGETDPLDFGIFDLWGLWFVRGNLIRDLASLNKMELLPWDVWGLMEGEDRDLTPTDFTLLDQVAKLIRRGDEKIYSIYQREGLKVPKVIKSYTHQGVRPVKIY